MTLIPVYIIFGIVPSFIWLLFYLKEDRHPEPNRMVLKVFLWGMISAFIAAVVEITISRGIDEFYGITNAENYFFWVFVLYNFLGIALVEELAKFWVVKRTVLKNKEFDEPVDAQLYMIISALGFAALENILVILPFREAFFYQTISQTIATSFIRFIGATFLHALASGTLGYFLALSVCYQKNRKMLIFTGLSLASLLHGLYNFSIIKMFQSQNIKLISIPVAILTILLIFVLYGFRRLNKIKSVCKI